MMSAPKSLSSIEQYGPARMRDRSTTRIPSRGFTTSRLTTQPCGGKRFPVQAGHDPSLVSSGGDDECASDPRSRVGESRAKGFLVEGPVVRDARPNRAGRGAGEKHRPRNADDLPRRYERGARCATGPGRATDGDGVWLAVHGL